MKEPFKIVHTIYTISLLAMIASLFLPQPGSLGVFFVAVLIHGPCFGYIRGMRRAAKHFGGDPEDVH